MALSLEEKSAHIGRVPFFEGLPSEALQILATVAQERNVAQGDVLCERGDEGNELFLITEGSVEVRQGERLLAFIGEGTVVGEMAVLGAQPRSADLVAAEQGSYLAIAGQTVRDLLEAYPAFSRNLLVTMTRRFREAASQQLQVDQLVRAYRERGHVIAALDPLGLRQPEAHPELELEFYGLHEGDLDTPFTFLLGHTPVSWPLRRILARLKRIYCQAVGVQFMHIDDLEVQRWLRERLENPDYHKRLPREAQLRILRKLTDAEVFETFLQGNFARAKRFSLEGTETLIPLLDQAIEQAGAWGVEEIVIGMPHRGRLNVLANIMDFPAGKLFQRFEKLQSETRSALDNDVRFHLGFDSMFTTSENKPVRLSLCFNPSHLEFVGPVVQGRVRARQDCRHDTEHSHLLPLIIHGDAAFAGQGIVQESLNLSQLEGYSNGGAIHIVLNNQIGFTTPPHQSRSTLYATDVARMLQVPIFHVNGERPEAVDRVMRLAMAFRQTWKRDVVIDMYGYRRHGHNEADDPTFTQPWLYHQIAQRPPIRETYSANLIKLGEVTQEEAQTIAETSRLALEKALTRITSPPPSRPSSLEPQRLEDVEPNNSSDSPRLVSHTELLGSIRTSVPREILVGHLERLTSLPESFTPHPKIAVMYRRRRAVAQGKQRVDWATGELLAFSTLLDEGHPIRISGQDSERGTFGHRHAVLHDHQSGERYTPLDHLSAEQASFEVYNSPLSEAAVLGFEFGYSLERPDALVIWEAQFGDFANGAQVLIDQFVVSSLEKWGQATRLCMFLPHGLEGEGPEHSSARPERFLQLAAQNNLRLVFLSNAAQVFHGLREQVLQPDPRPCIALTPKRLLQHPAASVPLEELAEGSFQTVLSDPETEMLLARTSHVSRILLCCGQLGAVLLQERKKRKADGIAILRVEQLYPFPADEIAQAMEAFPVDASLCWVQEEPENMGGWRFVRPHLEQLVKERRSVSVIARTESSVPAHGSRRAHEVEHQQLIERIFADR